MKLLTTYTLLLFSALLSAQGYTDSLRQVLEQKQSIDKEYIDALNDLTINLILVNPSEGIVLANESLKLVDSIDYPKGKFLALLHKGSALWSTGLTDQALAYYYRAKVMSDKIEVEHLIALNNNIAEVFKQKKLFDSALFYFNRGLELGSSEENDSDISILTYNIGELYLLQNESDSAEKYFHEAYLLSMLRENKRAMAYALHGLGELSAINDFPNFGIQSHLKALRLREEVSDKRGMIQSLQSLGNLYLKVSKTDSGLYLLRKSVLEAQKAVSPDLLVISYHDLAVGLEGIGRLKPAIHYLHLHHQLQDSLNQISFIDHSERIKGVLLAELVEAENLLLREQQELQLVENKTLVSRIILIAVVLFLVALTYYQYRMRLFSHRNAEQTLERNKKLTESAFMVSHNLREPVTQILGFIELNKATKDVPLEETWEHMEKSVKEIDEAVRQLAQQLQQDEDPDTK